MRFELVAYLINMQSDHGGEYRQMRATDLSGFNVLVDSITDGSTSGILTDPNPTVKKSFYRVAN